jgi:DNA mismatch repair protein MutS2
VIVNERVRETLEIDKILEKLARQCRSPLGVRHFSGLRPASSVQQLQARQELLRVYCRMRDMEGELPWDNRVKPVLPFLEEAKASAFLTGEELVLVRNFLRLAMEVRGAVAERKERFPALEDLGKGLKDFSPELTSLAVLSDDGWLYDTASQKLAEIRKRLEHIRADIRRLGHSLLNEPSLGSMLQERVLTLREGRYVLLVRHEYVNSFPGIALERSGSGNSVYMEPTALIPHNNRTGILGDEERKEERAILTRLTQELLRRERAIIEAEEALGYADALFATAEYMRKHRWHVPEVVSSKRGHFHFCNAVHPLLGEGAVPINIHGGERFRILVITGPNTGGKTVALKTVGVLTLLAWCGLPISAAEGAVVGDIDRILTDIGDEQSIEQNLSTFSAHMTTVIGMLEEAGPNSLVLLDELGAGTDPHEGAALGIALLQELLDRGSLVIATTHHNPIKKFALSTPRVETASVEFDAATLSPTFRLFMGVPGRSNALYIAERLGMPSSVVQRARDVLAGGETSVEELIGELQEKQAYLERVQERIASDRREIAALREKFERKYAEVNEKRDAILAGADRRARKILSDAEESARSLLRELEHAAESSAQRVMQEKKQELDRMKGHIDAREERRLERQSVVGEKKTLEVGSTVQLLESKVVGVVEELERGQALVLAGGMRIRVPLKRLRLVQEQPGGSSPRVSVDVKVTPPSERVSGSLMIRGMTMDEAIPMVERYLDQAYRYGYGTVSIIHGRGEGILRREVQDICKRLPYVEEQRLGGPGEGGYGVTIVTFRKKG